MLMNKEVKINFRVSEYEKKLLQGKVRRANMRLSDFCRKAVFEKEIIHIDGLTDCLYDLNKIGVNINQLAVAANQGRDVAPAMTAIKGRLFQTLGNIDKVLTGGDNYSDSQTD